MSSPKYALPITPARRHAAGTILWSDTLSAPVQFAFANASAAGSNPIIAAIPSTAIVVLAVLVISAQAQSIEFQSNTTAITAQFPLSANGGFSLPLSEHGWFQTNYGEGLNILLPSTITTGVQIVWAGQVQ